MKKEDIKTKINSKINELIDGVEKIGNINFFEIGIKNVNGDLTIRLENTYKEKVK
jgi:hypothetical protein